MILRNEAGNNPSMYVNQYEIGKMTDVVNYWSRKIPLSINYFEGISC